LRRIWSNELPLGRELQLVGATGNWVGGGMGMEGNPLTRVDVRGLMCEGKNTDNEEKPNKETTDKETIHRMNDQDLTRLSKRGDKKATYEKNRRKIETAQQSGDSSRIKDAHGAKIENKIADELGNKVVKAGEEVKYPNPNNPNRTLKSEIDLETDTEVIQIKSGKDLPEPRQIQTMNK